MADVVVNSDNKNPKELLGQGIRAYVLQDYGAAVSALSMASELLVAQHGDDLHDSLADVYLYYGKALLGLSREESEALGDAVPKNNEEESDEDEDEAENTETEDGDEKMETTSNGEVKPAEDVKDEKPTEDQKKQEGAGSSNGAVKEGEPCASGADESAKEETDADDEPSDLQVAWEVLELAKKIYERQGEESSKNLAETLIVLGEISLESENFEAAVKDIKQGLEMQKKLFAEDSRTVAETYYKLGIAYSTNSQIDEAIKTFQDSLQYLNNRVAKLEKLEDKKDEVDDEIQEIKQLIPDLEEKISDMKSYKDETLKEIMSAVTESKASTENAATSSSSSAKPASDISHLVKRKRKLDDIVEECGKGEEGNPAKKPPV